VQFLRGAILSIFLFIVSTSLAKTPVLIVPGVGASFSRTLFCDHEEAINDFEDAVNLGPRPIRKWLGFEVKKIPQNWTTDPLSHTYDSLIAAINEDPKLVAVSVPWDWRLPLDQAAIQYLEPAISKAKQDYAVEKVHIVAHSAGGLLVRYYLQNNYHDDVERVAFLATPHQGSVDAYLLWAGGDASGGVVPWYDRTIKGGRVASNVIELFYELLLENIKQGCGCSPFLPDFSFVQEGCPGTNNQGLLSFRNLLPSTPFAYRKKSESLLPISNMCAKNQNTFLTSLNASSSALADTGVEMANFASTSIATLEALRIGPAPHELFPVCEGGLWDDGIIKGKIKPGMSGDGRVTIESACPNDFIPAFAGVPCFTEDIVPEPDGRPPATKISHGEIPGVMRQEVVAFLRLGACVLDPFLSGCQNLCPSTEWRCCEGGHYFYVGCGWEGICDSSNTDPSLSCSGFDGVCIADGGIPVPGRCESVCDEYARCCDADCYQISVFGAPLPPHNFDSFPPLCENLGGTLSDGRCPAS